MKKTLFLLAGLFLYAYEAKVEPFDIYKIKSSVSGSVVTANKNLEAKHVKSALIAQIDDVQNRIDLQNAVDQEKILKEEIKNQEEIVKRKKDVYYKYKNLKTKSQTQKDLKFYDYMGALNQLLNLRSQLKNTQANIKRLKDIISKKSIKASGYVYKVYINKRDYVMPGQVVADVYDTSKEKITIFIPVEKIEGIKNKTVYINGKKSDFKVYKIWSVPDSEYVTSYRVDLVGNGLKFGEIVKVELK